MVSAIGAAAMICLGFVNKMADRSSKMVYGVLRRDGLIEAWDDVTNKQLNHDLVMKVRQAEMDYFRKTRAYVQVSRSDVKRTGGKFIGTRWIDVNTNYETLPDYRSRVVGK